GRRRRPATAAGGAARGDRRPPLGRAQFRADRRCGRVFGQHGLSPLWCRHRRFAPEPGGSMSRPIAELLSRFTPDGAGLDRDARLFAAGRASARPNRRWIVLATCLAVSQVFTLVVLWPRAASTPLPLAPPDTVAPTSPGPPSPTPDGSLILRSR